MFKEDTRTGLRIKLSNQEKAQGQGTSKASPTKRKALGKRTGGKPTRKLSTTRGMSLQTEMEKTTNTEKEDDLSSTSEENISPSPKRQNQKITPPAIATRKSIRARQATLATALGNPIPINATQNTSTQETKKLEIDSPLEKSKPDTPSLKPLIQEMGFSEKTPEYKACIQFIQAISPKHKTNVTDDVIDLTSPAEADDEKMDHNDIFCEKSKNIEDPKQDEQLNNEEEHGVVDDNTDKNIGGQRGEI